MKIGDSPGIQKTIVAWERHMPEIANWLFVHPDIDIREFFSLLRFDDKQAVNAVQHLKNERTIVLPSKEILGLLANLEEELDVNHGLYQQTGEEQYGLEMERLVDDIDCATQQFNAVIARLEESGFASSVGGTESLSLAEIKKARDTAYDVYRVALVRERPNSPNLKKMHREYVYWDHVLKAARIRGIEEAGADMGFQATPRPYSGGDKR